MKRRYLGKTKDTPFGTVRTNEVYEVETYLKPYGLIEIWVENENGYWKIPYPNIDAARRDWGI